MDFEELKQLQNVLKAATDLMSTKVKPENAVVFFGYTKSGKSTLLNYIINNELVGKKTEEFLPVSIVMEESSLQGPEIGQNASSKTIFPTRWESPQKLPGLGIWDLPGYDDNRGPVQDISGAYYIYEIFKSVKSMKIVLVIDINDVINDRINSFINLLHSVEILLNNKMSECFSNIVIIFTKVPNMINNSPATKERIGKIMNHQVLSCSDMNISETVKEYVRYLIKNPKNIGLFKTPELGRITNEIEVDIIESIKNAESIEEKILKSVTPSIASNSKNALDSVSHNLFSIEEFEKFRQTIKDFFNNDLEKFEKIQEKEISKTELQLNIKQLTEQLSKLKNIFDSDSSLQEKIIIFSRVVPIINTKHNVDNLIEMAKLMDFVDFLLKREQSQEIDTKLKYVLLEIVSNIDKIIIKIKLKLKEIDQKELEQKSKMLEEKSSKEKIKLEKDLEEVQNKFKFQQISLQELEQESKRIKDNYSQEKKKLEKSLEDVNNQVKQTITSNQILQTEMESMKQQHAYSIAKLSEKLAGFEDNPYRYKTYTCIHGHTYIRYQCTPRYKYF